jgi:hypothetical protein
VNRCPWHTSVPIALVLAAAISCGPELTAPGDTNVSGSWFADGPSAGLTNVTITLTQTEDGTIMGTYSGTGTPGPQFCPPTPPCSISGTIAGSNTVLQVFFELEHAGKFTGQVTEGSTLRGAMQRIDRLDPIEFFPLLTAGE